MAFYALPVSVRPQLLTAAAVLVVAEAVVIAGAAVLWLVRTGGGEAASVPVALFLVAFAAGVAVGLGAAARALRRGRRGARAPVITWQLLQGATCLTLLQAGVAPALAWLGLAVAALVVVLILLSPPVPAPPAP